MNEEERKAYQDLLEKLKEIQRRNDTPEKAMDDFEKYMKDCLNNG